MKACKYRHAAAAELLIANGADMEAKDKVMKERQTVYECVTPLILS
jgi:hypothetical protein